jgi:uncharacterized membrane protein (DUF485 family)
MEEIKFWTIIMLVWGIVIYGTVAFMEWSFSPAQWSYFGRLVFVLAFLWAMRYCRKAAIEIDHEPQTPEENAPLAN